MIKLTTNLKKQIRAVADIEKLQRVVVSVALRDVSKYAAKEAAKAIRDTRYSTTPINVIKSKIYYKNMAKPHMGIAQQSSETGVRGGDIPVMYMRPRNKLIKTRVGKRWGVVLGRSGQNVGKAFHLKARGKGTKNLRAAGGQPFDIMSRIFNRNADGSLTAVKFATFSEVLIGSGKDKMVQAKSEAWLDKRIERLFKQYLYQISRAQTLE